MSGSIETPGKKGVQAVVLIGEHGPSGDVDRGSGSGMGGEVRGGGLGGDGYMQLIGSIL